MAPKLEEVEFNPFAKREGASVSEPKKGGPPTLEPVEYNPFAPRPEKLGFWGNVTKPFTDYWGDYTDIRKESGAQIERGVGQITSPLRGGRPAVVPRPELPLPDWARGPVEVGKGAANVGLGAFGTTFSPYAGFYRSFLSKPLEAAAGIPHHWTEAATGFIPFAPKYIPPSLLPKTGPTKQSGITLTQGEATKNLTDIQFEQAAQRGQLGEAPTAAGEAFRRQRAAELPAARQNILGELDQEGQIVARSPQEAVDLVQQRVRSEEAKAKAGVRAAYKEAEAQPGMVPVQSLEDLPTRIPVELAARENPIPLGGGGTSKAVEMIDYLNGVLGRLRATQASAGGPAVTGLTLQQLDGVRKQLSGYRTQAYGMGQNSAVEGAAASAVMEEFDKAVEAAVRSGGFTGSPEAMQAYLNARAAHADYRGTYGDKYTPKTRDPVGNVVRQIIGDTKNDVPATISQIVTHIFGSQGVNPTGLNVAVVTRLRNILGENSPEWSAVKQGLFAKLTEQGGTLGEMAPGTAAKRITTFLDIHGKEMAGVLYSPAERKLIRDYGDTMKALVIPQEGANWSNSATFLGKPWNPSLMSTIMKGVGENAAMIIGGAIGTGAAHLGTEIGLAAAPLVGGVTAAGQKAMQITAQARDAARARRQMPVVTNTLNEFQRAGRAYGLSPTASTNLRLTTATNNLVNALEKAGIPVPDDLRQGQ